MSKGNTGRLIKALCLLLGLVMLFGAGPLRARADAGKDDVVIPDAITKLITDVRDAFTDLWDRPMRPSEGHSILYNARTINDPQYVKVGELHDIESYTPERAIIGMDENLYVYTLTPVDEEAEYDIIVRGTGQDAETLSQVMPAYTSSFLPEYEASDVTKLENDGHPTWYFLECYSFSADEESTEVAETDADVVYRKGLAAYVSNGEARTICIHIDQDADSAEDLRSDEVFESALQDVLRALTYEAR